MTDDSSRLSPVQTGGGTYISGNVYTGGGDFVAGDKYEIHMPVPQTDVQTRRNKQILIDKVWKFWVEGVLDKSLSYSSRLNLKKEAQPAMVQSSWKNVVELPNQGIDDVPAEKPIEEIFEESGRALLILGEPGAGKTVTLLELAKALLIHAKGDASQPIPVILNLSQWGQQLLPFAEWVVQELNSKYQIPKNLGHKWLVEYNLLLLLDGLDEVSRGRQETCVQAINQFSQEYGLSGIVVCSRIAEYTDLKSKLLMGMAIILQPLSYQQVDAYLVHLGGSFQSLQKVLPTDHQFQEFVRTPLFLSLLTGAYQKLPGKYLEEIEQEGQMISYETIFISYIQRMFKRKAINPKRARNTTKYLSFLAKQMTRQNLTVVQLEDLQPTWINQLLLGWSYFLSTRLLTGFVVSFLASFINIAFLTAFLSDFAVLLIFLISWLLPGILFSLIDFWKFTKLHNSSRPFIVRLFDKTKFPGFVFVSLAHAVILGVVTWLDLENTPQPDAFLQSGIPARMAAGFAVTVLEFMLFNILFRVYFWDRDWWKNYFRDIKFADKLSWSWSNAKKTGWRGLLIGLFICSPTLFILLKITDDQGFSEFDIGGIILFIFLMGSIIGGILFLGGMVFGGLQKIPISERVSPTLSLWRSFFSSFLGSAYFAIVLLIISLIIDLFSASSSNLLPFFISSEYSYFILSVIYLATLPFYGGLDFIKHWILRLILAGTKVLPFRLIYFLDQSTDLIFLRKVGGGYIFTHRLLQEQFATMDIEAFLKETYG